jgi:hypothetical protein
MQIVTCSSIPDRLRMPQHVIACICKTVCYNRVSDVSNLAHTLGESR